MDNYAGINKRVIAFIVDQIIFPVFFLFILSISSGETFTELVNVVFSYTDTDFLVQEGVLGILLLIVLETLMIAKLGWTPGKLLCGIYIKDANTLENIALMQVVIRSTLKMLLLAPFCISEWFLMLPVLVLIFAVFDKRKQFFHDKIAKTVVIDYRPEKCHLNLNCVGITRRVIAYIIDSLTIMGTSLVYLILVGVIFHIAGFKLFITRSCLFFLLPIVFGVFMISRIIVIISEYFISGTLVGFLPLDNSMFAKFSSIVLQ